MNSHIQVPRSIFDEFTNSNNFFYKYEVENNRVSRGFPKTTFTEEDYYSKEIESALNKYVETPLKKLILFARELPKLDIIVVEKEIIDIARLYIKSLIARSPQLLKTTDKNSVFFKFMASQDQHDFLVDFAMRNPLLDQINREYDFTFMINKSEVPFFIPTRGMFEYSINGVRCVNAPITPWCALMLKEKGKTIHRDIVDSNTVIIVNSDIVDMISRINSFAVEKQVNDGIGYVICYNKSLLEAYIKTEE